MSFNDVSSADDELTTELEAPASPTDAATVAITDRLDKIYELVFVFFILWLVFRTHGIFRSAFNYLKRGE